MSTSVKALAGTWKTQSRVLRYRLVGDRLCHDRRVIDRGDRQPERIGRVERAVAGIDLEVQRDRYAFKGGVPENVRVAASNDSHDGKAEPSDRVAV